MCHKHSSGLTSIDIPNSVTKIGDNVFSDCSELKSIKIPSSVTSFDYETIWYCPNLATLIVDEKNSIYSTQDNVLFNKEKTKLLYCVPKKTGSYSIPNTVKGIEVSAFSNCVGLSSVTIPNSVTTIGGCIFGDCPTLKTVYCKAKKVPYATSKLCRHDNYTLYVPAESLQEYKSTYPWSEIKNIVGE